MRLAVSSAALHSMRGDGFGEIDELFGGSGSDDDSGQPAAPPTEGFICPDCDPSRRVVFSSAAELLRHSIVAHSGCFDKRGSPASVSGAPAAGGVDNLGRRSPGASTNPVPWPAPGARSVVATRVDLGDGPDGYTSAANARIGPPGSSPRKRQQVHARPGAAGAQIDGDAGDDGGGGAEAEARVVSGTGRILAEGFICPDCARPFPDPDALLAHAREAHPLSVGFVSEGFICPICMLELPDEAALISHCESAHSGKLGGALIGKAHTESMEFDDAEMDALEKEMADEVSQFEQMRSRGVGGGDGGGQADGSAGAGAGAGVDGGGEGRGRANERASGAGSAGRETAGGRGSGGNTGVGSVQARLLAGAGALSQRLGIKKSKGKGEQEAEEDADLADWEDGVNIDDDIACTADSGAIAEAVGAYDDGGGDSSSDSGSDSDCL